MADTFVEVSEGSGKKLRSLTQAIGGSTVHEEVVVVADPHSASYSVAQGVATTTANDHIMAIMAGSTNKVRIRRIALYVAAGSVATSATWQVFRLTSAGTGGTTATPSPFDPSDAASGATARMLPTAKGTEGAVLLRFILPYAAAAPHTGYYEWKQNPGQKPIIIAAGTSNGIAVKSVTAVTAGAISIVVEFDETVF